MSHAFSYCFLFLRASPVASLFSLSLPFWSHIPTLSGHQFRVPFVSDLPHRASHPPTSPRTGDYLGLLHSCHPGTAFPVPLSLSTSSATLKLSLWGRKGLQDSRCSLATHTCCHAAQGPDHPSEGPGIDLRNSSSSP